MHAAAFDPSLPQVPQFLPTIPLLSQSTAGLEKEFKTRLPRSRCRLGNTDLLSKAAHPRLLATWLPGPCLEPASAWLEVELDASRYDDWRPRNGGQCDHFCGPLLVLSTPRVRLSSVARLHPLAGCRGGQAHAPQHGDTWAAQWNFELRWN
ncbi:hypothetical protein CMUS01_01260 [Colletotrichum musicola]|uniref:Uncharacterized protein n=1 Tax=Colletotrichum musicola TaxID=2175873 RepID=A0A8H6NXC3_9PEZI|nr:hypothetical protein CMUS01_01260 [Colletotrichum musicola]